MDIVIAWVLYGSMIGVVGHILTAENIGKGLSISIVFGIAGAIVGGLAAQVLFNIGIEGFSFTSLLLITLISAAAIGIQQGRKILRKLHIFERR